MYLAKKDAWNLLKNKLHLKFLQLACEVGTNPNLQPDTQKARAWH